MSSNEILDANFVKELERYHLSILCQCALLKRFIRQKYLYRGKRSTYDKERKNN